MKKEIVPNGTARKMVLQFSLTAEQAKQLVADTRHFIEARSAVPQSNCVRLSFAKDSSTLVASASNGQASLQKAYAASRTTLNSAKVVIPHTMLERLSAACNMYGGSTPITLTFTKNQKNELMVNFSFMDSAGSFDITAPQDGFMVNAPIDTPDADKLIIKSADFVVALETCNGIVSQNLPPNADQATQGRFTPYALMFKDEATPTMISNDIDGHSVIIVHLPATNTEQILGVESNLAIPAKLIGALKSILPRTDEQLRISCDHTRLSIEVGKQATIVAQLCQTNPKIGRKPADFGKFDELLTAKVQAADFKHGLFMLNTLVGGVAEEGVFNNYTAIAIDINFGNGSQIDFNVYNSTNPQKGCTGNVVANIEHKNTEIVTPKIISLRMSALMKILKAMPQCGQLNLALVGRKMASGAVKVLMKITPILHNQSLAIKGLIIGEMSTVWSGDLNKVELASLEPDELDDDFVSADTEADIEEILDVTVEEVVEEPAVEEVAVEEVAVEEVLDEPTAEPTEQQVVVVEAEADTPISFSKKGKRK